MKSAVAVFTVVASVGLVMAVIRLGTRVLPPKWLPFFHGGMALVGGLLFIPVFQSQVPAGIPTMALTVLTLAALGPFLLFLVYCLTAAATGLAAYGYYAKGEALPTPLLLVHTTSAVCLLLTLAILF